MTYMDIRTSNSFAMPLQRPCERSASVPQAIAVFWRYCLSNDFFDLSSAPSADFWPMRGRVPRGNELVCEQPVHGSHCNLGTDRRIAQASAIRLPLTHPPLCDTYPGLGASACETVRFQHSRFRGYCLEKSADLGRGKAGPIVLRRSAEIVGSSPCSTHLRRRLGLISKRRATVANGQTRFGFACKARSIDARRSGILRAAEEFSRR